MDEGWSWWNPNKTDDGSKKKLEEAEEVIRRLTAELAAKDEEISKKEKYFEAKEAEICKKAQAIQDSEQATIQELQERDKDAAKLMAEKSKQFEESISSLSNELETVRSQLQIKSSQLEAKNKVVASLESSLQKTKEDLADMAAKNYELTMENVNSKGEKGQIEGEFGDLLERYQALEHDNAELTCKNSNLTEMNKTLEALAKKVELDMASSVGAVEKNASILLAREQADWKRTLVQKEAVWEKTKADFVQQIATLEVDKAQLQTQHDLDIQDMQKLIERNDALELRHKDQEEALSAWYCRNCYMTLDDALEDEGVAR